MASCALTPAESKIPTSGVLALMLEVNSRLKADDAKCRLMASARAAVLDDGTHAYTVFQQGAGRVDAVAAVYESAKRCANRGLKIKEDLDGKRHFAGLAGVYRGGVGSGVGQEISSPNE